jgi:sialate O-acetylesterase
VRIFLLSLVLLAPGLSLRADVVPAPLFTDHAVLQRDKPVPVWGKAAPGEKITVTFAGQTVSTVAGSSGKWSVTLPPMPARTEPAELVITGHNTIILSGIVVGEVWLASGQSNMEWPVNETFDRAIDIPASARFSLIRQIKIRHTVSSVPAGTVVIEKGAWEVAGPATTGGFSAVGYYFAKDIYELIGVPVGIINCNWGGSPIEPWIDEAAYQTLPKVSADVHKRWTQLIADYPAKKAAYDTALAAWRQEQTTAKTAGRSFDKRPPVEPPGPGSRDTPSGLYNGMIHPLVPYALRGAIWYQGESNGGRSIAEYQALFPAMITGWRAQFAQGDFPFYWVQLANYHARNATGDNWARLREAQTNTLALPNTGQAVIIDIGNVGDVHPRNKKDVGRRLARIALKNDYGFDLITSGPVMKNAERSEAGFKVTFIHTDGGLIVPFNELGGFELAGEDKVFKPAIAKVEGDSVIVTSDEISAPVAVHYAWRNAPLAGLFNREGLPAVPFRSDSW